MVAEERHADERAHRVAEQVRLGDLELVHDPEHVLAHGRVAVVGLRRSRLASSVAARVHQHEAAERCEHVDPAEVDPVAPGTGAPAVHEHERVDRHRRRHSGAAFCASSRTV